MKKIPRLKRQSDRRNLTLSIAQELKRLYEIGKDNGHDTPALVREVVEKVILDHAEELKRPAS